MTASEYNLIEGELAVDDPPTRDEIETRFGALVTAVAPAGNLTKVQAMVVRSLVEAMAGIRLDPYDCRVVLPAELVPVVDGWDELSKARIVQDMMLVALPVHPFATETGDWIGRYAAAIGADFGKQEAVHGFGPASYDAAIVDFARNGYAGEFLKRSRPVLHTDRDIGGGWGAVEDDPQLAAKWADLETCPDGSLGRGVFDFYKSRHFVFPGQAGSAPPLLAQHDWVHVLADYGTTLASELEVFGLIARADNNPRGFSLLAMVIGLFETGMVSEGAGLFEADIGHMSETGMAVRLADAMRRGAHSLPGDNGGESLLGVDWFAYADRPVEEVRERFRIVPKSEKAIVAGSVGSWDQRGFSEYQLEHCDLTVLDRYI